MTGRTRRIISACMDIKDEIAKVVREQGTVCVNWYAELLCNNEYCDVREVRFRVKEFNYDPPHVRGPLFCPACRQLAKVNWIKGSRRYLEDEEREARVSVNYQRHRRDKLAAGEGRAALAFSFAELCDDALP